MAAKRREIDIAAFEALSFYRNFWLFASRLGAYMRRRQEYNGETPNSIIKDLSLLAVGASTKANSPFFFPCVLVSAAFYRFLLMSVAFDTWLYSTILGYIASIVLCGPAN